MRARYYCPTCLRGTEHSPPESGERECAGCGRTYAIDLRDPAMRPVERCAFCGNRAFFLQKDFDQRWGCLAMALSLAAAAAVGWRFGWIWFTPVLLATVVVDWLIAARIPPVTICYRCDAEYRAGPLHPRHRAYDPHVAERYAARKTLRRMR